MYANSLPNYFDYSACDAQVIMQEYTTNQVIWLDTVDSTNDYLKRILKNDAQHEQPTHLHLPSHFKHKCINIEEPVVCLAFEQTAGRGQFKRVWHSAHKQCLMLSMLLPLKSIHHSSSIVSPYPSYFSLICGLSLCNVLHKQFPEHNTLVKWPNDIVLNHKKLGGLLVEGISHAHKHYLIIGLGLNWHIENLNLNSNLNNTNNTVGLCDSAILANKLSQKINLYAFIANILSAWQHNIMHSQQYGFQVYIEKFKHMHYYEKYANSLHNFSLNTQEKIQAYYHSIDNQGYLYIQMLNGEILKLG